VKLNNTDASKKMKEGTEELQHSGSVSVVKWKDSRIVTAILVHHSHETEI
jgi:hypothetical protein